MILTYFVFGLIIRAISYELDLFDIHEASTQEWGNHIIYEHLTVKGKPEALRNALDMFWTILRLVFWPVILASDLLLKLWYSRR